MWRSVTRFCVALSRTAAWLFRLSGNLNPKPVDSTGGNDIGWQSSHRSLTQQDGVASFGIRTHVLCLLPVRRPPIGLAVHHEVQGDCAPAEPMLRFS